MGGEALAEAVLAFAARFPVDWLRLESCYWPPLAPGVSLDRSQDYSRLEPLKGRAGDWSRQLEAVSRVSRSLGGKRWVVDTVPSPWTLCEQLSSLELMQQTRRERPAFLHHALEALTQSLAAYARASIEAGAQGVVLVTTGNRHDVLTKAEYREWGWSYDRRVLEAAVGAPFNQVQLTGPRPHFELPEDLPVASVTWSVASGPAFRRSPAGWEGPVAGGLDETKAARLTYAALEAYVDGVRADLEGSTGVLLSPGAALPVDSNPAALDRLAALLASRETPGRRTPKPAREPRPPRRREEHGEPAPGASSPARPEREPQKRGRIRLVPGTPSSTPESAPEPPAVDPE